MNHRHNAVLRGGPADGQPLHVSERADYTNLEHGGLSHRYAITDNHELVDGSVLRIWCHQGTTED